MTGQRYWRDAQETFKAITVWLASGTEAAAALIIGLAAIEGTIRALWLFVPSTAGHGEPETMGTLSQHHILRQDARGYMKCPPGQWPGPYGHCRNTPFHGRWPDGSYQFHVNIYEGNV